MRWLESNPEPTALCIEDCEMHRELFQMAFERVHSGVNIHFEDSGEELARKLDSNEDILPAQPDPSLYFVDLCGTGITGPDLIKMLRSNDRTMHRPVIVLTGIDSQDDIDACYEAGASAYFVKPLSVGELELIIKSVVDVWLRLGALPRSDARQSCAQPSRN